MPQHDSSYKLLFSHPQMVEDLLRGFVQEEWVRDLDFSTLEKVSGTYVSDDLRDRADDVIWKARWGENWLYIYLLIEFQSTVDPFMAVRILTYVGLLYQDLIRRKDLSPTGKLPPVFPVVLYNGTRRWDAPRDVADAVETGPGGLEHYRPQLRYLLLEERRYSEAELASLPNLAAALFRLENSRGPEEVRRLVASLAEWLREPEQENLRRTFTEWLRRVLIPARAPGVQIPQIRDLQEVEVMLAERVKEWTRQWKQQGLQEGIQEGIQQGFPKGESFLLKRLLTRRFGALPPWVEEKLDQAAREELERWGDRILDAESLEAVFGGD
jgi:predicted transposase/invertase (TIGR01784 family)